MAEKKPRSKPDPDAEASKHEQELTEYLEERIKPRLNRGAIPLLARSIAKEMVGGETLNISVVNANQSPIEEFEAEMHDLQTELGKDWIVRFSVQGDDAWLTAEKEDGSQHVEAPTADALTKAVALLEEDGGRSG